MDLVLSSPTLYLPLLMHIRKGSANRVILEANQIPKLSLFFIMLKKTLNAIESFCNFRAADSVSRGENKQERLFD